MEYQVFYTVSSCTKQVCRLLSRYLSGMHEYEVELQFSSALLGHPDRTHDERGVVDGSEPTHGTSTENLLTEDMDTHELIGSPSPFSATASNQSSSVSFV